MLLKVHYGQNWVLVDGAILDVTDFAQRHPGGARLILNAVGTDITKELLGEEDSVGRVMSFTPYRHPKVSSRTFLGTPTSAPFDDGFPFIVSIL